MGIIFHSLSLCLFLLLMKDGALQTTDPCSDEVARRNCSYLGAKCDINSKGEGICACPPLYLQPKQLEPCNEMSNFSYRLTLPLDLDTYKMKQLAGSAEVTEDYFHIKMDTQNALTKLYPELLHMNVLNCQENFLHFLCVIELQFESKVKDLERIKEPGVCVTDSKDRCTIPPSLILRRDLFNISVTIGEMEYCDAVLKKELCGDETVCTAFTHTKGGKLIEKYFHCDCTSGYTTRKQVFPFLNSKSYIEECQDVNECRFSTNPCPQKTICYNTIGSYFCSCLRGYRPKNKTADIDGCVEICNPSPCNVGFCQRKGDHDFECSCVAGYTGALCDLKDENYHRVRTNAIIVGVVLGSALFVVIIVALAIISKLKMNSQENNPILRR